MRNKRTMLSTFFSFCAFIFAFIIFKLTKVMTYAISTPANSDFKDFPLWAINLIPIITMFFAFNSLSYAFTLYDKGQCRDFLSENRMPTFLSEARKTVSSTDFALKFGVFSILTVIISISGGFSEFGIVFSAISEVSDLMSVLLPILIIIPHFTLISILSTYEARRYWSYLDRTADAKRYEKHRLYSNLHSATGTDIIFNPIKIILRFAVIFIGYPLLFPYLPYLAFVVITLFGVAAELSVVLTVLGFIAFILAIFIIWISISYLRAIKSRRSFIKKLLLIAKEKGYTVCEIKNPIRSFFKNIDEENFTLKRGDTVYSCRFISTRSRRTPLYLLPFGEAYFLHRFGTKKHHISFHHNISYAFDAEGKKILLINPFPKRVFVSENERVSKLEPIDKIWGYLIYDDVTFLGALSRDCVGKTSGKFE